MNHSQLLSRSLEIVKKFRFLWLLSFLTILGGVATEEHFQTGGSVNFPTEIFQNGGGAIDNIGDFFDKAFTYLPIILIVILVLVLLGLVFFVIGLIAKGGLIDSILKIDAKKTPTLGASLTEGKKYAWKIFLVRLLFGAGTLLSLIVVIPLFIILILFFFITIPALWVFYNIVSVILKNAQILIVAKNMGVIESTKTSYKLFRQNWKKIAILWLIQLGLGLALTLIILLFTFIIGLIIGILTAVIISFMGGFSLWLLILIIPGTLLLAAIVLFTATIVNTFFTSYWTLGINSLLSKQKLNP